MKVLIVGAGHIAGRHVEHLARIPESQVVGICDLSMDHAHALAKRCSHEPVIYTDYRQAIANCNADYLLLTTPRQVRLPVIEACVAARLPVLLEKPPCHDMQTGHKIAELFVESELLHGVAFMHRYHDALNHAWQALGGSAGLRMLTVEYTSPMATKLPDSRWPLPYLINQSGGLIGDQGIHYIDLARYLTQAEPVESIALFGKQGLPDDPEITPDTACWAMRMHNGCFVSHAHTWCSDRWRCEVTLIGPSGKIAVDMFGNTYEGRINGEAVWYAGKVDEFEAEHRAMQQAIAESNRGIIRSDYQDALRSFQCVLTLHEGGLAQCHTQPAT